MKKNHIQKPPRIYRWLLVKMKEYDQKFSLTGDLAEFYAYLSGTEGRKKANIWYLSQILSSVLPYLKFSLIWRYAMLRNYLCLALRNIKNQKVFSAIKILGLSLALAFCIWTYLFVKHELSYDRFHENADSIYSVINTDFYYPYTYRNMPIAAGPALKEYFPEIEHSVRISRENPVVRYENNLFREDCHLADKNFFEFFSFSLLQGDKSQVLESENSIVLARSTAVKYFPDLNAVGKTLTLTFGQKKKDFFVTGIAEDPPPNSTIVFDMIIRIENIAFSRSNEALQSWTWPRSETYIQLKKEAAPESIEAKFPSFVSQYFSSVIEERKARGAWNEKGETITFWLQNIKDIYLHSQGITSEPGSHINKSYILGGIGLLVLLIACINFTNLSLGKAFSRTAEIGMRKILGAGKKNIVRQFLSESIVIMFLSMSAGVAVAVCLLPFFNRLAAKSLSILGVLTFPNVLIFTGAAVIVGVLAGFYPGIILANIEAARIIKGHLKLGGKNRLTRILIVVQFSVSVFLIISTLTMAKQIKFINTKDLGFQKEGVVIVETLERAEEAERIFNLFKQKTENLASVRQISGCAFPLGGPQGEGTIQYNNKKLKFRFSQVTHDYFATMGMEFLAGGDFPQTIPSDINPVVVNELFVKSFEINDPIGKNLDSSERPAQIVGVVEDYHYSDLRHEKEPVIHLFSPGPFRILLRVSSENIARTIDNLRNIWKEIQVDKPFIYSFQDQILENQYKEEKRWNAIVLSSAVFVLLITCMGLVGMTTIITNRRTKEIGIRKVLGASIMKISRSLCSDFVILTAVSNFITWPVAFYIMNLWLKNYAYRTNMDFGIFLAAGLLSFVFSLGTIAFLVYKAASSNPVDCLRYE
ncbi:MAG: ABC transporter permease [Candidatus Aminicenantes bacterium]|nr:ABC transporter permease [Candidatus Aminicenantes bacterium]